MQRHSSPLSGLFLVTLALVGFPARHAGADWTAGSPAKWVQMPDTTTWGIDIRADRDDGVQRALADDFRCTNAGKITELHIWGSWFQDQVGTITNLAVAIYQDIPAGQVTNHSLPGTAVWSATIPPSQWAMIPYLPVAPPGEYWWDAATGGPLMPGDTMIWQLNIHVDPAIAYEQQGTPSQPLIYWLGLWVQTDRNGVFGWKTRTVSEEHFQDDAVWTDNDGQGYGWHEMLYPPPHPLSQPPPHSIDLAFVIGQSRDYGDAMKDGLSYFYPVLLADDGARHVIDGATYLGADVDRESNGQPDANALGDDSAGSDDEDGVSFSGSLIRGRSASIAVAASTTGWLQGWVDYNRDGDWGDAGEQVFVNTPLSAGVNALGFSVPAGASLGSSFGRFRFSTVQNLQTTGDAPDGEVEDYKVTIEDLPAAREPKWNQPLDTDFGMDVWSFRDPTTTNFVADDFRSDGRPITGIRWWGSYKDWMSDTNTPVAPPPAGVQPTGFRLTWYRDIPAGIETNYSVPGNVLESDWYQFAETQPGLTNVTEQWYTSIYHNAEGKWEHEFVYDVTLTNEWLEKEGVVYWLSIEATYQIPVPPPMWGWATTSREKEWNDDAVRYTPAIDPTYDELRYNEVMTGHPYGTASVNTAFVLYTDVAGRRAAKWRQPPDMVNGINAPSFTGLGEPPTLRADDFMSDGRRITDVHWWGSYLNYLPMAPGPVEPPMPPLVMPDQRPTGFWLSWHTDIPAGQGQPPEPWSRPGTLLQRMYVPIANCHEMYYGTVAQSWEIPPNVFEHEFQYYVDLLDPALPSLEPWYETNGVIYWLDVQAQFSPTLEPIVHNGWGWKTTYLTNRLGDASAVSNVSAGQWTVQRYVNLDTEHPYTSNTFDLAFEITTDEVGGTNRWYGPIVLTGVAPTMTTGRYVIATVGDLGAGVQVLQFSTNLRSVVWSDVKTNANPIAPPWPNVWYFNAASTAQFYRVIQR